MPRQTKETVLPKPPPAPIDWVKIAQSGRVWDFVEGEDFSGQASGFRARAKTAARKSGVDFESAEVERGGKTVLKVLARMIEPAGNDRSPAGGSEAPGGTEAVAA